MVVRHVPVLLPREDSTDVNVASFVTFRLKRSVTCNSSFHTRVLLPYLSLPLFCILVAIMSTYPDHPYYLLEHLVHNVLPEKCRHPVVQAYYHAQLNDPDGVIDECKDMLAPWVLRLWDRGHLWTFEE